MSTSKALDLYLITFNCGRELINPEVFASHLFDGLPASSALPDLVVLNLQEISPIAHSFLGGSFVTPYFDQLRKAVNLAVKQQSSTVSDGTNDDEETHYINVRAETAGMTGIMVFVRSDLLGYVSDIMTAGVGVGVQEMGNKGAIGVRISWSLNDTASPVGDENETDGEKMNMTFVSAHLAAMEEELERRNQDYKDIVRGLVFTPVRSKPTSSKDEGNTPRDEGEEDVPLLQGTTATTTTTNHSFSSSTNSTGIYDPTSHLFFAGDLNYRTSSTPPSKSGSDTSSFPTPTTTSTSPANYLSSLLQKDQLSLALKSDATCHGLTESFITFAPTYKYKFPESVSAEVMTESDFLSYKSYPFAPHRWPSWCDRILYSSSPSSSSLSSSPSPSTSIKVKNYTSLPLFRTSDHRPVALSLSIPLSPVSNAEFAARRPVDIDGEWKGRREAARRKEIVVGALAYVALTWEGRGVGVGMVLAVLGAVWMARGLGG